ncbi:hypothetical protein, partial [Pontibacillus sp. HN14]
MEKVVVEFGYKVEDGKTKFCAVLVRNGRTEEEEFTERSEEQSQYIAGMNAFCLAAKVVKEFSEDTGFLIGEVEYRSVQQYLDLWVKKGKNKKYTEQINFINSCHTELGLEDFAYVQQKGGREGKKNNLALVELYNNKKGVDPFEY